MFQLIIAVISIALISALAIASIFYGGNAFSRGNMQSAVASLVNSGQQIAGAQAMYRTDNLGSMASQIGHLTVGTTTYLSQTPARSSAASGDWTITSAGTPAVPVFVSIPLATGAAVEACKEVLDAGGTLLSASATTMATQFGCTGPGATPTAFAYKF